MKIIAYIIISNAINFLIIIKNFNINNKQLLGIGDWGLGIGDWGLGIGPNPQSPIPNPKFQSSKKLFNIL